MVIDRLTPRRKNLARLEVNLRVLGPAVHYEVGLDLEADGSRFDVSTPKPAIRPSMGCDDEELSWGFEIPEDELDRVWVIASWMEAHGTDLRMAAIAWCLSTPERLACLGGWPLEEATDCNDAPAHRSRTGPPGTGPATRPSTRAATCHGTRCRRGGADPRLTRGRACRRHAAGMSTFPPLAASASGQYALAAIAVNRAGCPHGVRGCGFGST